MIFGEMPVGEAVGAVLAHSAAHASGHFKKGRVLSASDVAALAGAGHVTVFAARLEADDVAEDEAAARIAQAITGAYAMAQAPFTGRANLHSAAPGVVLVDAERVRALNRIDESLTLATLPPFAVVEDRQLLATVKIIPYAVKRQVLDAALAVIGGRPLVSVAKFSPRVAGLVITQLPQTKASIIEKSRRAMEDRLEAMGSRLGEVIVTGHDAASIGNAVARLGAEHDLVLVFGASAIVDRGDVVPQGLVRAGGEIVHLGMPVDPGNLLLLGRLGPKAVIGVPSCARSPKVNGFDWVLARVLAGLSVTREDIMDMGAGGLLMEIPLRPLPREADVAGKAARVAAVVLAAGQSARMGANKMLVPFHGQPMIRQTVTRVLESQARPVIVVTGRDGDDVRAALKGLDVAFVHNADFAAGLASSLATGVRAVPGDVGGVMVLLGDMPLVTARQMDRLIAAFNPLEGRRIVVPSHEGRRGNPVLWGRDFFGELEALRGDQGGKPLLEAHAEWVVEVDAGSDTVHRDFDVPGDLEDATAHLLQSPRNAERLLTSIAELEAGGGTVREIE